ncbi:MAG: potassium-transporting ATPase subunit KdpC [Acidocella sp.]|nr:potassium-transporting ATPase subunit KdpC [Acidocella sp.]
MVQHLRPAAMLILLFTLLTGIALPLGFTGIAQLIAPFQANGSLLVARGHIIGSALIGQNFTDARYFWPRPSAITSTDAKGDSVPDPYDADNSGASNLAPTSKALIDRVRAAIPAIGAMPVPADAVTSSASGLDPDISPENAALQIPRIAGARHLSPAALHSLISRQTHARVFGIFGQPHLNVLALNLALDGLYQK